MQYAYPADELMPLSCEGRTRGVTKSRGEVDDALGNFQLTLIDSLDTLALLGYVDDFKEAVVKLNKTLNLDGDFVISTFETNIRVLGGLLGGHAMALELAEMGKMDVRSFQLDLFNRNFSMTIASCVLRKSWATSFFQRSTRQREFPCLGST